MSFKKVKNRINWAITEDQVRLIDEHGVMCGVVSKDAAVKRAISLGLDLVEISSTVPPVCKIIDYGKYIYSVEKKISIDRKKQKVVELKEIKLRPYIADHDYETKLRLALRFLDENCKIKFSIRFMGREILHPEVGMQRMQKLVKDIESSGKGKVETGPKLEGNIVLMVVSPM